MIMIIPEAGGEDQYLRCGERGPPVLERAEACGEQGQPLPEKAQPDDLAVDRGRRNLCVKELERL